MRTRLFLFTVTAAVSTLVACSDDRSTTGPRTPEGKSPAVSADVAGPTGSGVQAAARPSYGFTTILTVVGPIRTVLGAADNEGAQSAATCPTGSFAIGGGYNVSSGLADVRITSSKPNDTNTAWIVSGAWFGAPYNGTNYGEFYATAVCIR